MAQHYSPRIVTDNLVMCLDPSQNKSYPTTDLPVKGGLLLWLDASDDTTFTYSSGTEVSQWRDKSGNNFHANQSTVANQPSRNSFINSRKGVNFTSTSGDFMRVSSGIVTPNYITLFAVVKPATQDNNYAIIMEQDHGNGYNGWVIQRNNNTSYWQSWVAGNAVTWLNPNQIAYTDNTSQIVTLRKTSSTINLYSNGTSSSPVSISDSNITQSSYGLNLGYWQYGGGRYYNGVICEILVFNRGLSDVELRQVNTYLGQKWGILNTDRSIIDLSGNNDNGLLGNGTVANIPAYDYYNTSLRFDGTNDYIFLNNSQLNISTSITVEAWVKHNAQGGYNARSYSVVTCKGYPWTWLIEDQSGQFNFRISTSVTADSNVNSSYSHGLNNWNHVVGTYDGLSQKIYVNGILQNSTSLTGTINTSSNDAMVGCYNYGDYCLTGNIGAVRVYSRALSATEITQNYEAQKSRFANTIVQQGLVLNLDAGNPYSYAGAGTAWYDVSGSGFNGILTNGPIYNSTNNGIIVFDGSNDYIDLSTSTLPISGNGARSIFIWMKTTATGLIGFVSTGTPASSQAFNLVKYSSGVGVMGYNNDYYPSAGAAGVTLTDGNWHYIGATFDGSNLRTYADGKLDNTSGAISYSTTGQYNYIGRSNHAGNENFLNGSVGLTQIYNRALSATEVLQNYNATKGRFGL